MADDCSEKRYLLQEALREINQDDDLPSWYDEPYADRHEERDEVFL